MPVPPCCAMAAAPVPQIRSRWPSGCRRRPPAGRRGRLTRVIRCRRVPRARPGRGRAALFRRLRHGAGRRRGSAGASVWKSGMRGGSLTTPVGSAAVCRPVRSPDLHQSVPSCMRWRRTGGSVATRRLPHHPRCVPENRCGPVNVATRSDRMRPACPSSPRQGARVPTAEGTGLGARAREGRRYRGRGRWRSPTAFPPHRSDGTGPADPGAGCGCADRGADCTGTPVRSPTSVCSGSHRRAAGWSAASASPGGWRT